MGSPLSRRMTWVIVIKTALGLDFRSFGLSLKRPTFSHKLAETAGLEVGAALCAAGGVQLIIMLVLANKPHLSCWACLLFGCCRHVCYPLTAIKTKSSVLRSPCEEWSIARALSIASHDIMISCCRNYQIFYTQTM